MLLQAFNLTFMCIRYLVSSQSNVFPTPKDRPASLLAICFAAGEGRARAPARPPDRAHQRLLTRGRWLCLKCWKSQSQVIKLEGIKWNHKLPQYASY